MQKYPPPAFLKDVCMIITINIFVEIYRIIMVKGKLYIPLSTCASQIFTVFIVVQK